MSFAFTERWLMDAGGWPAMKAARAAWQSGAVLAVEFDGVRLRGSVRSGGRTFASGLLIKSPSDVANLCPCPASRRDGALCEHSLALGLAWIHREKEAAAAPADGGGSKAIRRGRDDGPHPVSSPITKGGGGDITPNTSGPLAVVLPPQFFDGLLRERLGLSLRPVPLAPPVEETAADRAIHAWLATQRLTRVPPQLALADRQAIDSLLSALCGHPRITLAGKPFSVMDQSGRLPLQVSAAVPPSDPSEAWLHLRVDQDRLGTARWWIGPERVWVYGNDAKILGFRVLPEFLPLITDDGRRTGIDRPLRWIATHGAGLSDSFDWDEDDPAWPRLRVVPGHPEFRLVLDGSLARMSGTLFCRYSPTVEFSLPASGLSPDPFPLPDPRGDRTLFLQRHPDDEAAAVARLTRAGFTLAPGAKEFIISNESQFLQFFAGDLRRLEMQWKVEFGSRAGTAVRSVERVTPQFQSVAGGSDWLAFDLSLVGSGGTTVSQAEARRWLQTGQGHRRLPNGRIAVLATEEFADLEHVLRDIQPEQERGHFRIKTSQLSYLATTSETAAALAAGQPTMVLNPETCLRPALWNTILRDYQRTGIRWMLGLAERGWGGILADEMGLGKTIQTLAVISVLRTSGRGPCLVVAPTSLLGNWQAEAATFAPELRVQVIRSGERAGELAALGQQTDLVITSYPLLVRDLPHYTPIEFQAVFLDEAGFVRNPDTQASKAVRLLRARTRFALTGTPIENSIRDLWAITEFGVPGYLGPRDDFRDRYEIPLQAGDAAVLGRLRRRMSPYWLRRLKEDVAADLPKKLVTIVRCDLTAIQRDMYAAIQREGRRKVDDARRSQSAGQARMTMLTALLRLRQTCGDPRLLGETFPGQSPDAFSGKWSALLELLDEIRDGGHSVLIFSQFASQLRLLKEAVTGAGLGFCHLDGSTPDRDAQIAAFRDDPAKRVFLISLKAGGFGLNLTKADTVIHFDPWWNPAVEAQATDRAHRIGQIRPVTVYKLIATGTVEEKILALQQRKQRLMESALDDAAPLMEGLHDDELLDLVREA